MRYVAVDGVLWADLPDRQEAGSPNVLGAVALGVACRTLQAADMHQRAAAEADLLDFARAGLAAIPGIQQYRLWSQDHPRVPVLPFTLNTVAYAQLAAVLSAEYGIGVRHGCFCAHPLMVALLGISPADHARLYRDLSRGQPTEVPGAVRASIGLGTTSADISHLIDALDAIATAGPRWSYRCTPDGTDCWPDPDPRPRPPLPLDLGQ